MKTPIEQQLDELRAAQRLSARLVGGAIVAALALLVVGAPIVMAGGLGSPGLKSGGVNNPNMSWSGVDTTFGGEVTVQGNTFNMSGAVGTMYWGNAAATTGQLLSQMSAANATATNATMTAAPAVTLDANDAVFRICDALKTTCTYFDKEGDVIAGATASTTGYKLEGVVTDSSTDVTVTACSGGTAATITWANGTAAFQFDVGTSCASESTAVITLPASTVGWVCGCSSTTADRMLQQKVMPASTTSVTMQNIVISSGASGDFTDGADVVCQCRGGG